MRAKGFKTRKTRVLNQTPEVAACPDNIYKQCWTSCSVSNHHAVVCQTQPTNLFPLTAQCNNKAVCVGQMALQTFGGKYTFPASIPVFLSSELAFDGRRARYKPQRHRKRNNTRMTNFCNAVGPTCASSWSESSWTWGDGQKPSQLYIQHLLCLVSATAAS